MMFVLIVCGEAVVEWEVDKAKGCCVEFSVPL